MSRLQVAAKDLKDPLLGIQYLEVPTPQIHLLDAREYALHLNVNGECHIGIDKQLILEAPNADAIAFILGHELGHEVYRKMYSIQPGTRATPIEEMFCDKFGLVVSVSAGYSARGAIDTFDYFIKKNKSSNIPDTIKLVLLLHDEHINLKARWAQVKEDFVGISRILTGSGAIDDGRALSYVPQNVLDTLASVQYISPFKAFLEERDHQNSDAKTKCETLLELLPQVTNQARRNEYLELLQNALLANPMSLKNAEVLHELCDSLLERTLLDPENWHELFYRYYSLAGGIVQSHDTQPLSQVKNGKRHFPPVAALGKFREISTLVETTLASESDPLPSVEELKSSIEILNALNRLPSRGSFYESISIHWPIEKETAIDVASKDPSGTKLVLLFHTYFQGQGDLEIIDKVPLATLEAAQNELVTNWPAISNYIEERKNWEQDINSYDAFKKDPVGFICKFRDVLFLPNEIDSNSPSYLAAHPYSKLNGVKRDYYAYKPVPVIQIKLFFKKQLQLFITNGV